MHRRRHESLKRIAITSVFAAMLVLAPAPSTKADEIYTVLPYVIDNHDRVRAAEARLTAARNRAREALGDWYPTLGQTLNAGHERQQNDGGDDSSTGFNEYDISLTQLLWDFGSTNAAIDKARLQVEEARYSLIETRQSLILEAVTAYMNLVRARATRDFADESEANIRRQTGLEEALVSLGSGFSTDVLQAKTQLAGAQARRAQNEGALINALNRYKAVFGRMPDDISALGEVPYPSAYLPTSLTQSVDISLETNPALKNAILAADIAVEDVRIAKADNFFPRIEASGERKFKKNVGGTIGSEQETLAKVEMTLDFNLGFTAINTLKASKSDLSASTFTAADTRRNIEEQVRNAWQQLDTARRTASHLNNQANIAAAFLELARNERQLGRRSLIDVLSGETNLINSRSDALSAETDVIIAAYGLLAATGQLNYDIIKRSKGMKAPIFQGEPQPSAALQKNGSLGSLISEDNRSSQELMAMLRKTVKAMPVITKKQAVAQTNVKTTPAEKAAPEVKTSPVVSVQEKPVPSLWEDRPAETSNYNTRNEAPDTDAQIASIDASERFESINQDYVPSDGDLPVDSTPHELAEAPSSDTAQPHSEDGVQDDIQSADTDAYNQIAALTVGLPDTTEDTTDRIEIPAPNAELSTPQNSPPSIADAFKTILSFFDNASDTNSAQNSATYETHDVAALDWSTPLPESTNHNAASNDDKSAPSPVEDESKETPRIFKAILSFFNNITNSESDVPLSDKQVSSNDVEVKEADHTSINDTAISIDANAKPKAETVQPGIFDFLSSLFDMDTIVEKVNYSKLDNEPNEEFGR